MKIEKIFAMIFTLIFSFTVLCAEAAEKIILVTGFSSADKSATDSSWEAIKNLNGKPVGKLKVVTLELPASLADSTKMLQKFIKTKHPVMIISFGQGSTNSVVLETTARNVTSKTADNNAITTANPPVYAKGATSLDGLLPTDQIKDELTTEGIPVDVSDNAGVNESNDIFYTLMYEPGSKDALYIPRGLVLVPAVGAKGTTSDNKSVVFDQALLEKAAKAIIASAGSSLP